MAQIEDELKKRNFELMEPFVKHGLPHLVKCGNSHTTKIILRSKLASFGGCKTCTEEDILAKCQKMVPGEKVWGQKKEKKGRRSIRRIDIECKNGHRDLRDSGNVLKGKSGCQHPDCKNPKISKANAMFVEEAKSIAWEHGIELLSDVFLNQKTKYEWKCLDGHPFFDTFDQLKQRHFKCKYCYGNIFESKCRFILEALCEVRFPKERLEMKGQKLELDGYNQEHRLAFEAQGRQHRQYVKQFHGNKADKKFENQLARDEKKRMYCKENGIALIEIHDNFTERYRGIGDDTALVKEISEILGSMGISFKQEAFIDWNEFKINQNILEEMREYAVKMGGELLSLSYLGVKRKHEWSCNIHGYFNMPWDATKRNNRWCPRCAKNASATFEEVKAFIENIRGASGNYFKLKSTEYTSANIPLEVECDLNHPISHKDFSHWRSEPSCPLCSRERMSDLFSYKEPEYSVLATEKNFTFIGLEDPETKFNQRAKAVWECNLCKERHPATYPDFSDLLGCRVCRIIVVPGRALGWKYLKIIQKPQTKVNSWIIEWACIKCGYRVERSSHSLKSNKNKDCTRCKYYINPAKELGWKFCGFIGGSNKKINYECQQCGSLKESTATDIKIYPDCQACKQKEHFQSKSIPRMEKLGWIFVKFLDPLDQFKSASPISVKCRYCGASREKTRYSKVVECPTCKCQK